MSCFTLFANAQTVSVKWEMSDVDNLSNYTVDAENEADAKLVTGFYSKGTFIGAIESMPKSGVEEGYTAVNYDPAFASFTPTTRVDKQTSGHSIRFTVTPGSGRTFKPNTLSFDAAKVGTDGGNISVVYRIGRNEEVSVASNLTPLRNKINATNSIGFTHYEFDINDAIASNSDPLSIYLYIYNLNGTDNENPKAIAFRNVTISGEIDGKIYTADTFVKSFTATGVEDYYAGVSSIDITSLLKGVKNGETVNYPNLLYGEPTDLKLELEDGCTSTITYEDNTASVQILKAGAKMIRFNVKFNVTNRAPKGNAKALGRGLMSVSLSGAGMGSGNLVSWRFHGNDDQGTKFLLYRGTATAQTSLLNNGKYIVNKTNFRDASGTTSSYYKLETYDKYGNLIETVVSGKTWGNQSLTIPTQVPVDNVNGATYTPNDASYCDMDGDGEYEIILKWSPSNEKDAASSGTTSNPIFDCYKLDGTRLWRIDLGQNFFTSAHTIQFIAWDFDGDGYGEFMCKTAPGTIDGEGNYVLLGKDDPKANLLSGRGKQDHGSEYITVFDGITGGALATIPYHTDYNAGLSYWGDSNQNRSERYLAALAYLDGPDKNPSPIFARGYYSGAFVGAYDWDGKELKCRWVSRNTTKGQGLWGEGAHWISVGDCDEDGKQEIVYGSAALDHDGKLLYRTGLGHGDALHLGDFITSRPGLEVFMVHEEKPYGYDLRDAKTGKFILHVTASGDTGRGLAAHFDSSQESAQFIYSASGAMFNCIDGKEIASSWALGSSGAGINCRIYWDGDLYDEFFDKSIIAHWNPKSKSFDRFKFNNGNYLWGNLNNDTKRNPCVMGDILGDWREEIITWDGNTKALLINATSYESEYRIPHLMDDLNYRVQVVNQNCAYNQPPHLSFDPAVRYKGNPNVAVQEDEVDPTGVESVGASNCNDANVIYTIQGVKVNDITAPGVYIVNGRKIVVK